ncbi:MAG: PrgI family protein [Candidatus Colwellbacteria bacterium]|nr:PrgI family protein [Candidatus Colwellbacteria bacterium]
MQFQLPQFIETETKAIGPFTLVQFIAVVGASLISYLFYFVFEFWLWIILAGGVMGITLLVALGELNGRPAGIILIAVFEYLWQPKVYARAPAATSPPEKPKESLLNSLFNQMQTSARPIPRREESPRLSPAMLKERFKRRLEAVRKITGEREDARRVDYR